MTRADTAPAVAAPSVAAPTATATAATRAPRIGGPGRPRDPHLDARILAAASRVYAGSGWAGFTFEAVARTAGAGKPAIYRRWDSREELLFAAVDATLPAHDLPDTGSIRGDLIGMARQLLDGHDSVSRDVGRRLEIEAAIHPDPVGRIHRRLVLSRRGASRAMVLRGIERGELRPDTPITTVLDLVAGATGNHWRNALPEERDQLMRQREAYLASVVDAALASFLA